jgi:GTP pyrophosphokinase
VGHIVQLVQPKSNDTPTPLPHTHHLNTTLQRKNYGNAIVGANDLMTRLAKCCKPIPGDSILGYITQGRGISIHKKNCNNIKNLHEKRKLIEIAWEEKNADIFSTDLNIVAEDHEKVLHDLTSLLANEKIVLLRLNSTFNKNQQKIFIHITVQIQDNHQLQKLLHRIQQLTKVIDVFRAHT